MRYPLIFALFLCFSKSIISGFDHPAEAPSEQLSINHDSTNQLINLALAGRLADLEEVEALLKNGACVNIVDSNGSSLLHGAVMQSNIALANLLLRYGANVNVKDEKGVTPLYLAVCARNAEMLLLFICSRAHVDEPNEDGTTPLIYAAYHDFIDMLVILTQAGANIHANQNGATPLHFAAQQGNICSVTHLLQQGAQTESRDGSGDTPLHYAARAGKANIVYLLLQFGADIEAKNNCCCTPLAPAFANKHLNVLRILITNGIITSLEPIAQFKNFIIKTENHKRVDEPIEGVIFPKKNLPAYLSKIKERYVKCNDDGHWYPRNSVFIATMAFAALPEGENEFQFVTRKSDQISGFHTPISAQRAAMRATIQQNRRRRC